MHIGKSAIHLQCFQQTQVQLSGITREVAYVNRVKWGSHKNWANMLLLPLKIMPRKDGLKQKVDRLLLALISGYSAALSPFEPPSWPFLFYPYFSLFCLCSLFFFCDPTLLVHTKEHQPPCHQNAMTNTLSSPFRSLSEKLHKSSHFEYSIAAGTTFNYLWVYAKWASERGFGQRLAKPQPKPKQKQMILPGREEFSSPG